MEGHRGRGLAVALLTQLAHRGVHRVRARAPADVGELRGTFEDDEVAVVERDRVHPVHRAGARLRKGADLYCIY